LQGKGLAFLPDINEFLDLLLQDEKTGKWGFIRGKQKYGGQVYHQSNNVVVSTLPELDMMALKP